MSKIEEINSLNKAPVFNASNTGYMALTGLSLTTASAMVKNKSINKLHKPAAYITTGLTLLHLGIVLHNHKVWKEQQKKFDKTV